MNELSVEQAIAALVNHYVAASAGLVSENVMASHGFKRISFLFTNPESGAEAGKDYVNRDFAKVWKRNGRSRKHQFRSNEALIFNQIPSENINAFFKFAQERIAAVSQEVASDAPREGAAGFSQVAIAHKLNDIWSNLTEDVKEKYRDQGIAQDVSLGTIGVTATVTFGRKFDLENFVKHASSVPSLSIPVSRGAFASKERDTLTGIEKGIHFRCEMATHPGMFVGANLYATGVLKVTLVKLDLTLAFNQIRDLLIKVNAAAHNADPPVSVYNFSLSDPLHWSDMKLALIKKQFDLGFRIKYSKLASLLASLEGIIFADIRSPGKFGLYIPGTADVSNSGSGIFARFIRRNLQDGEFSFYAFHSGIVQINGSRGATFDSVQSYANALFAFFTSHRHMLEPSSELEADGSKRKRKRMVWQIGMLDNSASMPFL